MQDSTLVIAFSLMMEEPGLPADVALHAVTVDGISLPPGALVEPLELLRLAAIGLAAEQT